MKRVTPDLWENSEAYPKSESGSARVVVLCDSERAERSIAARRDSVFRIVLS